LGEFEHFKWLLIAQSRRLEAAILENMLCTSMMIGLRPMNRNNVTGNGALFFVLILVLYLEMCR
jgi:hypothetical protein